MLPTAVHTVSDRHQGHAFPQANLDMIILVFPHGTIGLNPIKLSVQEKDKLVPKHETQSWPPRVSVTN